MKPLRVGIISDYLEEGWTSMDAIAEMLVETLQAFRLPDIEAVLIRPPFIRRIGHAFSSRLGFNADRFLNRFIEYPKYVRRIRTRHDIFHIIDHSYGHLVHDLPSKRTLIACHDLDTFECVLKTYSCHKSRIFKAMTRRILRGLQSAAVVSCDSYATRNEILAQQLVPMDRLVVNRNGVHPAYSPRRDPIYDERVRALLGPTSSAALDILHVASTIPRKRVEKLLQIFAAVREHYSSVRLIRVGGTFTRSQTELVEKLQINDSIVEMPRLERRALASVYRRATMLVTPSAAEGFGLPVVEAMACGTPVIASDIPVLHEIGGATVDYRPVDSIDDWVKGILALVEERRERPLEWQARRSQGLQWTRRFSSSAYASKSVALYHGLAASAARFRK
jgi:glycosyltransferase involved in cell wall biosynthesis